MSVKICYLNEDLTENVDKDIITKQLIENVSKKINLDPSEVKLKIGQIFLQDEKCVRKVLETNFILIYHNEHISIKINDLTFVMEVTREGGRSVEIKDLTGEITIGELKKKLSAQFKFDMKDIILKHENENIMEDEKLLKDYIYVKSLEIVVKNKTKIKLNITHNDETFSLNAYKEMTGKELQDEINKKIQINNENYILEINGERIELENTLHIYEIVDDNVIIVKNITKINLKISHNGETFSLNVFKEMTAEELEKEINKKVKIPIEDYFLEFNGKRIELENTLNFYEIVDDNVIIVKEKTKIKLNLKFNCETFSLNVFKEMTGEELQDEINKKIKIPIEDYFLELNGKTFKLGDSFNIDEINNENEIVVKNKTKIKLNFKHNDETFSLNAYKEMTGKELQDEINKKIQINNENYILEFNGKRIELENTLKFYKIFDCDIVVVKNVTKTNLNITHNGETFSLNAYKEMTGEELRNEINRKMQLDIKNYILEYNGKRIEFENDFNPYKILDYYNISDDDAIVVKIKTRVRIIIKHGDRYFSINAFKEMTGEELQKVINEIFHTKNDNFNLDYNAKIIESNDTLSDHGIDENNVIMAVPKLEGGE